MAKSIREVYTLKARAKTAFMHLLEPQPDGQSIGKYSVSIILPNESPDLREIAILYNKVGMEAFGNEWPTLKQYNLSIRKYPFKKIENGLIDPSKIENMQGKTLLALNAGLKQPPIGVPVTEGGRVQRDEHGNIRFRPPAAGEMMSGDWVIAQISIYSYKTNGRGVTLAPRAVFKAMEATGEGDDVRYTGAIDINRAFSAANFENEIQIDEPIVVMPDEVAYPNVDPVPQAVPQVMPPVPQAVPQVMPPVPQATPQVMPPVPQATPQVMPPVPQAPAMNPWDI